MDIKDKYGWDYFQNIYDNNIRKGQTFSYEIGLEIEKEIEKMKKQKEEWLKNKDKKEDDYGF